MSLKGFIKDKIFLTILLVIGVGTTEIFLIPYRFGSFIKIYLPITIFILYIIGLSAEYFTKRNFYKNIFGSLEDLDEKYLISEIIETPNFTEGRLLKEVLEDVDKSMCENVNKYKFMRRRL